MSILGYCNPDIPKLLTRLGLNGKIRTILRFKTFTFSSFDRIHSAFYPNGIKIVPHMVADYLSPLALAIWIMDGAVSSGLKIATNSFTRADTQFLCNVLKEKYGLVATVNSAGAKSKDQYCIYIWKESMPLLARIVKPHMHPSMLYKLNSHI